MSDRFSSSVGRVKKIPLNIQGYFRGHWDELSTSILTESMREYLLGELEFSGENADQKEIQKRMRLRNRVEQGIIDFSLIVFLDERDVEIIFKNLNGVEIAYQSLVDVLSFIYLGMKSTPFNFDEALEEAILVSEKQSPSKQGKEIDNVEVEINKEYKADIDLEAVFQRFTQGDPISRNEFAELIISDSELFSRDILNHIKMNNGEVTIGQEGVDEIMKGDQSVISGEEEEEEGNH